MPFDLFTLPNGLRVIGERMPHVRSVSVGLWMHTGSRHELSGEEGLSHFLEHMVFKGTETRSARQIAEETDAKGVQINAFTGKEYTCFYAKAIDEHIDLATDIVCDLVRHPVFDAAELEKEKGVVLEEISMEEDTPEDMVGNLSMTAHFGDAPLAKPILGTAQAIRGYHRDDLEAYWRANYHPQNAVFSIAGNYDPERLRALIEQYLGEWPADGMRLREGHKIIAHADISTKEKDIEQIHMDVGFPGLEYGNLDGYKLSIFNSAYGGAMSSRLFQKIREEAGMVYTVYSSPSNYIDCGMLSVYAATNPNTACSVYEMILEETRRMVEGGMTRAEFDMSREQLKSGFILGGESSSARMLDNGRRLLLLNRTRTEDETIKIINGIGFEETNELMRAILRGEPSLALIGRGAAKLAKQMRGN